VGLARPAGFGRLPDNLAARRRIERSSGLAHRPLQALSDRPSTPLDGAGGSVGRASAAHGRSVAPIARGLADRRTGAA
jgi:hypothetical protein